MLSVSTRAPDAPLSPPPNILSPRQPGTVRAMSHMISSSGPEIL